MKRNLLPIATAACLMLAATPAFASQTWDYAAEWSIANGNPNNAWTYGYQVPSTRTFTAYTNCGAVASGLAYWAMPDETVGGNVVKNQGSAPVIGGGAYIAPQQATMHPGQANQCVVRWIAPRAMWIRIEGAFAALAGGDGDAHVLKNGVSLCDGIISGYLLAPPDYTHSSGTPEFTFSQTLRVSQGDDIRFVLGLGPDSSWYAQTTGLRAIITDLSDTLGSVTGHVVLDAPTASPIWGATVRALGSAYSTVTDENGCYTLQLPAADHMLEATHGTCEARTRLVRVQAGGLTTCDFILAPSAFTTYYVRPDGDDSKDGLSYSNAWRAIDNGDRLMILNPGDRVHVEAGTYSPTAPEGYLLSRCGGSNGNPIAYWAHGQVVVDRQNSSGDNRGFTISGSMADYTTLDGFEITGCPVGIAVTGASNVTARDCLIRDTYPMNGAGDCTGVYSSGSDGLVLSGNTICRLFPGTLANAWAVKTDCGGSIRADNNLIYDIGDAESNPRCACLSIDGVAATIRNNTLDRSGTGLVQSNCTTQFVNNIIADMSVCGINRLDEAGVLANAYNLYHGNAISLMGRASSGAGEMNADPLFVSSTGGDYHLQSGSPAIDTGIDVGLPFVGSAPDMGAVEFYPTVTASRIGELRSQPERSPVTITVPKVVTASSTTFIDGDYYVEEPDRASGIRISPANGSLPVVEGDRVTLTGVLGLNDNGERVIEDALVQTRSPGFAVSPFGITSSALHTPQGLDPASILARIWGWVTYKPGDGSYVCIADADEPNIVVGQKSTIVVLDNLAEPVASAPEVGEFITVTGIVALGSNGSRPVLVIRPRRSADISTLLSPCFAATRRGVGSEPVGPERAGATARE